MPLSPQGGSPQGPPNTPIQGTQFAASQYNYSNTPTSRWSSSGPSTPRQESSEQVQSATPSPILSQDQQLSQESQSITPPPIPTRAQQNQRTLTFVPVRTVIRRLLPNQIDSEQSSLIDIPEGAKVDLRGLDYVSVVDENLICPICRSALVNPATTSCDHVFCKECLDQSYRVSPTCPVDRCRLSAPRDFGPTHRLIMNQLDGLEVRCPNASEGCQRVLARSMVQNHVDKYCEYALVECPGKSCDGKVPRKDISSGCLHYTSSCPDCAESVIQLDMLQHRSKECAERKVNCRECGVEILRCKAEEHGNSCEETEAACMWVRYGCTHKSRRKNLPDHAPICDFKVMGAVVDSLKAEIDSLRSEVWLLKEKDKSRDRRLKFLESERPIVPGLSNELGYPIPGFSDLPQGVTPSIDYAPFDSRDQYLLSLVESQETKVDQISLGLTELEAKQTMMLFNETIPIKEQLAELRSAQGVLGMHVRWLLNFRIQERAAAGPSNQPKSGGSGQDFQSRRSSDTTRELVTKL